MATLVLVFKKIESEDKTRYDTFYSNSKADYPWEWHFHVLESIYTIIILNIQKFLGKGSGWIIDSIIECNISISLVERNISILKYNPWPGGSYI